MAVPAAPPVDEPPAHGLEAREDVLEDAREHVVGDRGGRWPSAGPRRRRTAARRARPLEAALEDVALAPELEHALLHLPPGRTPGGPRRHRRESCGQRRPARRAARAPRRSPRTG